jgi:hypothetical protein
MFKKFYRVAHREPRGLFVADVKNNELRVGFSLCCDKKDVVDKFDRNLAHKIAVNRMEKGVTKIVRVGENNTPLGKDKVFLSAKLNDDKDIARLRSDLPQPFRRMLDESVNFYRTRLVGK